MTGELAKIKKRHREDAPLLAGKYQRHDDRAWLLGEVERLEAEIERLKREPELLRADLISLCNASRGALGKAYSRARITAPKEDGR